VRGVALAGLVGVDGRVALVVAARKDSGIDARSAASAAAKAVGGGGGGTPELATAGGKVPAGIGEALDQLRAMLGA
jgi:alanyl-tRNA synthetase